MPRSESHEATAGGRECWRPVVLLREGGDDAVPQTSCRREEKPKSHDTAAEGNGAGVLSVTRLS